MKIHEDKSANLSVGSELSGCFYLEKNVSKDTNHPRSEKNNCLNSFLKWYQKLKMK